MLSRWSRPFLQCSVKRARFFSADPVGSVSASTTSTPPRLYSAEPSLHERLEQLVPEKQAEIKELKKQYGDKVLGQVTVNQVIGGMRGIPGLLTETSLLDANDGIKFRGLSIPEVQEALPKLPGTEHPISEGMFWFLMTGEVPSLAQAQSLTREFHKRAALPEHVVSLLDSYPKNMHPMTQLSSAILALQTESAFVQAYDRGENRMNFWRYYLEDSLDIVARLPEVASRIFQNVFRDGSAPAYDDTMDWAANYAQMLGFDSPEVAELMRMYINIHSDHEGGNVSAHTTHLVGSALSDPYLSLSAGLNGLAGPLHGLANQEVLRWILTLRERLGNKEASKEQLRDAVWETLNNGQVIPGYGHAVLRKTDPRYTTQREFALNHLPDDPLFKLVSDLYEVVPEVLTEHGKTANPWPNVDAHSGVLLSYYGLVESRYYTVLFGVSRALGVLSSLVNDRILGLPIERPKSLTSEFIRNKFN